MTVHSRDTPEVSNWPNSQTSNPTSATHSRRGTPEAEPMNASIPDDLPDVINVPEEELYSDHES